MAPVFFEMLVSFLGSRGIEEDSAGELRITDLRFIQDRDMEFRK